MDVLLLILDKISSYVVGYLIACGLSFCAIDQIYQELWKEIKDEEKDKDHKLHRWYGGVIGVFEGFMYVTALLLGKYDLDKA